jgi:uncharacterized DUF497 family protein
MAYHNGADDVQYAFEFDEAKSRANKMKHGIGFVEAQELWRDENLLRRTARSDEESRQIFIGMIEGTYWSAIATYRGEAIRLISVRRSRPEEVQAYGRE